MYTPNVVIFVKIAGSLPIQNRNPYHVGGLAANALHTVGVLRTMGVQAHLETISSFDEIRSYFEKNRNVTHAIIEAVWITPSQLSLIADENIYTKFIVRAHSKIGFLQVEPEALLVIRDIIKMSNGQIKFSSNNEEFCFAMSQVYGPTLYLPNLYDIAESPPKFKWPDKVLRIGSFGATRLLKMHPSAALAALQLAAIMNMPMEFYINTDKTPGGDSVRRTIRNMFVGLDHLPSGTRLNRTAKLIEVPWQNPEEFKATIAKMDLVLQLSATETFCLVAADAVASGVPVIVGPAITWIDPEYQAPIDDTTEVAAKASRIFLLGNQAIKSQQRSLKNFIKESKQVWSDYLGLTKKSWWKR